MGHSLRAAAVCCFWVKFSGGMEIIVMKYVCPCGYVYDPDVGDEENGIAPGTAWEDVPEDWVCPICGLGKDAFEAEE